MGVIYLQHPKHGKKVATLEAEAVADEKNGWVRFEPPKPKSEDKPTKAAVQSKEGKDII